MKTLRAASALVGLPLLFACAAAPGSEAPVWRAETIDGARPLPTLVAAGVYDYHIPARDDAVFEDVDLELLGDIAVEYAKENPEEVIRLGKAAVDDVRAMKAAVAIVEDLGPELHARVLETLGDLGFALETDGSRASKLEGGGIGTVDAAYVAAGTVAVPFGDFPMFGPGSKGSIVKRLGTGQPDEAYLSIHAQLRLAGNRLDGDGRATLSILALNANGDVVFRAQTSGIAAGAADGDGATTLRAAFEAALARVHLPD